MKLLPTPFSRRPTDSEARLILFGLCALLAVYLGFLGVSVSAADDFVKRRGYAVMFGTFGLFLLSLWRLGRTVPPPRLGREHWSAVGAIGLFSLLAINAEPFRCKVLFDEFVLQATAFNMHYFREVMTMVRGHEVNGVFLSLTNYLDKRPYFYPFLVSLLHDGTGYRPANAFLLNAALLPAVLALVYHIGRQLTSHRGGLLAVLLLGSLPLLGQNATGSGMELLNVFMLLVSVALGAAWLRRPDEVRLAPFVLAIVLLAQTRYESVIFVLPAALLVLAGWWRAGRMVLPWAAVVAPLLLVPYALQNKVLSHSPALWELHDNLSARFSPGYFPDNVRHAFLFFFNFGPQLANSFYLAGLGCAAFAWLFWRLVLARPSLRTAGPARLALAAFSLGIFANATLIMFYFWAHFDDPMASRFSLPLHLVFAFAAVLMAADFDRRIPATRLAMLGALIFTLGVTTGRYAGHLYSRMGTEEVEWELRFIAARGPGDRLIITGTSSLPWLVDKIPAILIDRARLEPDRLRYHLEHGTYREMIVTQGLRPTTENGDHEVLPEERLPAGFHLEMLAEKRFGSKIARVSRLVAVDAPPSPATAVLAGRPAARTESAGRFTGIAPARQVGKKRGPLTP